MSCGSFGVVPNCFTLPLSFLHNFRSSVPEDKTVFVQLVQIENEKYGNTSNDSLMCFVTIPDYFVEYTDQCFNFDKEVAKHRKYSNS